MIRQISGGQYPLYFVEGMGGGLCVHTQRQCFLKGKGEVWKQKLDIHCNLTETNRSAMANVTWLNCCFSTDKNPSTHTKDKGLQNCHIVEYKANNRQRYLWLLEWKIHRSKVARRCFFPLQNKSNKNWEGGLLKIKTMIQDFHKIERCFHYYNREKTSEPWSKANKLQNHQIWNFHVLFQALFFFIFPLIYLHNILVQWMSYFFCTYLKTIASKWF